MHRLAELGIVNAAMDNSDGLLRTLNELAYASAVGISLDLESLRVARTEGIGVDPARLWLGWGDCNVLVAVSPKNADEAIRWAAN
jgi:thiamine-monophosphate kinase